MESTSSEVFNMNLRGCFVLVGLFGFYTLDFRSTRCYKCSEILMLVLFGSV